MLARSGIPPPEPTPMFLIISAIPPRPAPGAPGILDDRELDSLGDDVSSLVILACEFWSPDFRPAFPGSSLRPRSKALAEALKSPREYCACLERRNNKKGFKP